MSVAVNYYLGFARGKSNQPGNILTGIAPSGTAADVEVRMQIDNGTGLTGLTKDDVVMAMEMMKQYVLSNGVPGGAVGTNLPKL